MRIIAGPLAGTLHMPWKKFAIFNFLGAATWVTAIAIVGYVFGGEFKTLVHVLGRAGWVLAGAVVVAFIGWRFWHARVERSRA
jgi:membrane-associated protein